MGSRPEGCVFYSLETKGGRPYLHIIWVMFRSEACGARNITKAQIMLNQGRPNIEGRAKRSPNRKGSRPGMRARPGGGGGSGRFRICFVRGIWVHFFDGGCAGPGAGAHLRLASERMNIAGFVDTNEVRWAGIRIMSGGNS